MQFQNKMLHALNEMGHALYVVMQLRFQLPISYLRVLLLH